MQLPSTFRDANVCIVGLGYVGLTLAVALADAGFQVHGVEVQNSILKCLDNGRSHFSETGLTAKLIEQIDSGRLTYASTLKPSNGTTVFIVTVGTPIDAEKRTQYDSIQTVASSIGAVLRSGDMVILRSTVRIGTTREIVKVVLDKSGVAYDLAFCPERTLEGRALQELRSLPQIIGGVNDHSTLRASQFFSLLTPSVVRVSDLETAELVKLINNTQRDYNFAFANEVAAICDAIGVSAVEVIESGNLGYPRANMPMPGPVGGPCLEKDPYILAEGLHRYGFTPALALASRRWNESLPAWSVGAVAHDYLSRSANRAPSRIALLGLAFKGRPETDDLRGTLATPILECIRQHFPDAALVGWDAVVSADGIKSLGIKPVATIEDAFSDTDIVFIQNNHDYFAKMKLRDLSSLMHKPGTVYDYWNQFPARRTTLANGIMYRGLGTIRVTKSGEQTEAQG